MRSPSRDGRRGPHGSEIGRCGACTSCSKGTLSRTSSQLSLSTVTSKSRPAERVTRLGFKAFCLILARSKQAVHARC